MESIKLQILRQVYWEHFKKAKDLAQIYELNDPRRLEIEQELNKLITEMKKENENN